MAMLLVLAMTFGVVDGFVELETIQDPVKVGVVTSANPVFGED